MNDDKDQLNQLLEKLDSLLKRQDDFSREINSLRVEINRLKVAETEISTTKVDISSEVVLVEPPPEIVREQAAPESARQQAASEVKPNPQPLKQKPFGQANTPKSKPIIEKADLEKFIGENLINKIGIIITIIGVAIGAKYSIDNDLISPLTRIILGYAVGLGLLGFGIKLKRKYENYSAVLVSGAMAIMYFLTYAAYDFYNLFPQIIAFGVMVIFTIFTVVAAINYNRQVIAHIGLVGGYAVPFLLSDGSGKVGILFSYMAIINIGILAIAFRKYWKLLYYAAFALSWLIFYVWFISSFKTLEHFGLGLFFLSVFFATFYVIFLAYKLIREEKFEADDIVMLLANSFVFFGIGSAILDRHQEGGQFLGLFTLLNAGIHFGVSVLIYRRKLADRNLFYLVSGLVMIFLAIAVPVQLDGNWVTLLWALEAALLFWIGRTKNVSFYEKLSYPLMMLAFFSVNQDWLSAYHSYIPAKPETRIIPLLNINFLSSLVFVSAFGFINVVNHNKSYPSPLAATKGLLDIVSVLLPALLLFSLYNAFRLEISNYWSQLFADSAVKVTSNGTEYPDYHWNYDYQKFETLWVINYSLLFGSLLSVVNNRKIKNAQLGLVNLAMIALTLVLFLTLGLYELSELRDTYLHQPLSEYYHHTHYNILIRYISFGFVGLALVACYQIIKQDLFKRSFKIQFDILLHTVVLWVGSSELIHWMGIAESTQSYKLGLSILWGAYSLLLIILGIWKKMKHLRVGAIALFGATLLKLFCYDISHLNTIAKTIVFVSLGVLLLIISFLYNKYKHNIADEIEG